MRVYLVGGAVRNYLLGLPIKERDWLVVGSNPEEMLSLGFKQVAKSFPVFLHPITKEEYALARKDNKISLGYTGFECDINPQITLEEDLKRRDLTINAIAMDESGNIYDPFGGQKDLNERRIKHVSPAFREDPLRVLRTARFAASLYELGFFIDTSTWTFMLEIVQNGELNSISKERLLMEFYKSFATKRPDIFIQVLYDLGVFQIILKPLNNLTRSHLDFFKKCRSYTKDNDYLLALLLYYLPSIEDTKEVLKELKVPKKVSKLCNILREEYIHLSQVESYSVDSIFDILNRTRALKQETFFSELIGCSLILAKSSKSLVEEKNLQLLQKLLFFLKDNINYQKSLQDKPKNVSYETFISNKQREIIKNFMLKYKS